MVKFVIIDKAGNCKDSSTTDLSNIYKKCGMRSDKDFEKRVTWKSSTINISVYAKKNGRANTENKFDMPPPIDSELYFGCIAVVGFKPGNDDEEIPINLDVDKWCKVYEKLMGGFEDLGLEDSEDEEDVEEIPPELLTKHGYMKDSFIADSDEEEDISGDSEEEESLTDPEDASNDGSSYESEEECLSDDNNDYSELSAEEYLDEEDES